MSVIIIKEVNKRAQDFLKLREKAKTWIRKETCRRCGSIFAYDATDLQPSRGSYGSDDYLTPYIRCPVCDREIILWFKVRLWNRWIGKYLQLQHEFGELSPLELWKLAHPGVPPPIRIVEA
jgi:DNA-directed RNA polymerase subunit RPC12/RpoP